MKKKNITLIVLAIILIGGFIYITKSTDAPKGNEIIQEENNENIEEHVHEEPLYVEIGKEAPNFTISNMDGEFVTLEDYRGKNVLLNFWATWCPYCVQEMPDMNKLYNENKDKDFVVLAVSVQENKETVAEYIKELGYDFTILLDEEGIVADRYMIRGIPTSYMIDKEGKVKAVKMSMMTYDDMKQLLENANE